MVRGTGSLPLKREPGRFDAVLEEEYTLFELFDAHPITAVGTLQLRHPILHRGDIFWRHSSNAATGRKPGERKSAEKERFER